MFDGSPENSRFQMNVQIRRVEKLNVLFIHEMTNANIGQRFLVGDDDIRPALVHTRHGHNKLERGQLSEYVQQHLVWQIIDCIRRFHSCKHTYKHVRYI